MLPTFTVTGYDRHSKCHVLEGITDNEVVYSNIMISLYTAQGLTPPDPETLIGKRVAVSCMLPYITISTGVTVVDMAEEQP